MAKGIGIYRKVMDKFVQNETGVAVNFLNEEV